MGAKMTNSHVELPGSRRPLAHGARRVREIDPHTHVEVTLMLNAPPLPGTDEMPDKPLTVAELTHRFGASPHDIRKVEDTLRSYGLHVEGLGSSGRSMRVSGTAHAIETAFKSSLAIYHSADQGEFRGREGAVCVPAEISDLVHSVLGLDQRRMAHRAAAKPKAASAIAPLRPADVEEYYNFPPGDGATQSIAIAEFGIPHSGTVVVPAYFPDDLAAFCKAQKRPTPEVRIVAVNLAPLTPAQYKALPTAAAKQVLDETTEVMMDVEIVAGLCPAADISVYFAGWDQKGWVDLLEKVTAARPVVLSISYGLAEDSPHWAAAAVQAINDALQVAAMAGITVCVCAGDDGSGSAMPDTRAHVQFPSSSPFVLAVGGTMVSGHGATQSEVVWWETPGQRLPNGRGGATGGGVSAVFDRPVWQTATIASLNHGSIPGRIVPDVAALAGVPYYAMTLLGEPTTAGGTSAATPVWASLIARIDAALPAAKRQRFRTPILYQDAHSGGSIGKAGCTSVTSGNNASHPHPGKGYVAGPGFDAVTGWGVPDGKALLAALK
jgi:kumamolisin